MPGEHLEEGRPMLPDEPVKSEALRAIARLERRAGHPYSAQLIDLAADEIDRLRANHDR